MASTNEILSLKWWTRNQFPALKQAKCQHADLKKAVESCEEAWSDLQAVMRMDAEKDVVDKTHAVLTRAIDALETAMKKTIANAPEPGRFAGKNALAYLDDLQPRGQIQKDLNSAKREIRDKTTDYVASATPEADEPTGDDDPEDISAAALRQMGRAMKAETGFAMAIGMNKASKTIRNVAVSPKKAPKQLAAELREDSLVDLTVSGRCYSAAALKATFPGLEDRKPRLTARTDALTLVVTKGVAPSWLASVSKKYMQGKASKAGGVARILPVRASAVTGQLDAAGNESLVPKKEQMKAVTGQARNTTAPQPRPQPQTLFQKGKQAFNNWFTDNSKAKAHKAQEEAHARIVTGIAEVEALEEKLTEELTRRVAAARAAPRDMQLRKRAEAWKKHSDAWINDMQLRLLKAFRAFEDGNLEAAEALTARATDLASRIDRELSKVTEAAPAPRPQARAQARAEAQEDGDAQHRPRAKSVGETFRETVEKMLNQEFDIMDYYSLLRATERHVAVQEGETMVKIREAVAAGEAAITQLRNRGVALDGWLAEFTSRQQQELITANLTEVPEKRVQRGKVHFLAPLRDRAGEFDSPLPVTFSELETFRADVLAFRRLRERQLAEDLAAAQAYRDKCRELRAGAEGGAAPAQDEVVGALTARGDEQAAAAQVAGKCAEAQDRVDALLGSGVDLSKDRRLAGRLQTLKTIMGGRDAKTPAQLKRLNDYLDALLDERNPRSWLLYADIEARAGRLDGQRQAKNAISGAKKGLGNLKRKNLAAPFQSTVQKAPGVKILPGILTNSKVMSAIKPSVKKAYATEIASLEKMAESGNLDMLMYAKEQAEALDQELAIYSKDNPESAAFTTEMKEKLAEIRQWLKNGDSFLLSTRRTELKERYDKLHNTWSVDSCLTDKRPSEARKAVTQLHKDVLLGDTSHRSQCQQNLSQLATWKAAETEVQASIKILNKFATKKKWLDLYARNAVAAFPAKTWTALKGKISNGKTFESEETQAYRKAKAFLKKPSFDEATDLAATREFFNLHAPELNALASMVKPLAEAKGALDAEDENATAAIGKMAAHQEFKTDLKNEKKKLKDARSALEKELTRKDRDKHPRREAARAQLKAELTEIGLTAAKAETIPSVQQLVKRVNALEWQAEQIKELPYDVPTFLDTWGKDVARMRVEMQELATAASKEWPEEAEKADIAGQSERALFQAADTLRDCIPESAAVEGAGGDDADARAQRETLLSGINLARDQLQRNPVILHAIRNPFKISGIATPPWRSLTTIRDALTIQT